jgi:glutamate dehydrogenase
MSEQSRLQVPTPPAGISRGSSESSISDSSTNKVQNLPGYTTPVFKGKEEQRAKVQVEVASKVRDANSFQTRCAVST